MYPKQITKEEHNIFSGEREIGTKVEEFSNDHVNRYDFARYFVKKTDVVLDAACGVGYGSHMLAEKARKVYGIDYNQETIGYALKHWNRTNLEYIRGDLLDEMSYPKKEKFNIIVSFETIEHLTEDSKFLALISERLLPNGLCFISAPNSFVKRVEENIWHVRHYSPEEFMTLAKRYFGHVWEFSQIDCGVRKGRGGDNNILICSHSGRFQCKLQIYLLHNALYQGKKRILKVL
jgi:O-antigen biosynthesis protein